LHLLEATGINALLVTVLTLLVALRLGQILLARLAPCELRVTPEVSLLSLGLGLGAMSLLTLALGVAGLFYRPLFQLLLLAGVVASAPRLTRDLVSWLQENRGVERPSRTWVFYPAAALLIGIVLICLVAALAPETGFDALNYHLGIPRLYMANHGVVETSNLAVFSYPLGVDMLFLFAWLVHSPVAAKLVHFAFGLLTAAGCWVFLKRLGAPHGGVLAALLFLGSPVVMYLSHSAYIDLGLAFFSLLALIALFRWLETGLSHWSVLAGIYAGLSLSAKYTGFTTFLVGAALMAWTLFGSSRRKARRSDLVLYGIAAFLVFSPWLVKNLIQTGNPVSPLFADLIPTRAIGGAEYNQAVQLIRSWHGYAGTLFDWISVPWLQTFRPDVFHGSPGAAYLVLLPVALVIGWRDRRLRILAGCIAVGYVFLVVGTLTTRFFVLLFPWISVLVAAGIWPRQNDHERSVRWAKAGLVLTCLVLVAAKLPWFNSLWVTPQPLTLDTAKIRFFRTAQERDDFLEKQVTGPGGAEFYSYLNGLKPGARILALTPVYQALTDHRVFMPPNSKPSSEMALAAIELAKKGKGLSDVELTPLGTNLASRFWKVRLEDGSPYWPDETRLRPFFIEKGVPIEVAVYRMTQLERDGAIEVVLDLGAPRKVERFTLLSRARSRPPTYRLFSSPGWSASRWREVAINVREVSSPVSEEVLCELLSDHQITHVVLGYHPGAQFLPQFYVDERALSWLIPVKSLEGYEVLEVRR